jgi:predicted RNA binding protein YcfA (HicA-like mRNA interferase family)
VSPALSDLPVRKVIRALESVGFAYVRTKGSHAVYRRADGRVVVIPEHGTIKRGTLGSTSGRHA